MSKHFQKLSIFKTQFNNFWNLIYQQNLNNLKSLKDKFTLLSPTNILKRGYSIAFSQEGQIIKDSSGVDIGSNLKVKLAKGQLLSKVLAKEL